MKKFLKAIAWVMGILVVGFGVLVAINAVDEEVAPELQKLLVVPPSALKDEDNAYFAVWGMTAAEDADPHAVGKRVVAQLNRKFSAPLPSAVEADLGEVGKLKISAEIGKLCDWAKQDCYEKLVAAVDRAAPLAAEHRVMLERLTGLGRYRGYRDTGPASYAAPVPPMQNLIAMSTLQLLLATADVKRGDAVAGLNRLESGIGSLRMLLGGADNLIAKMVATSILHRYAIALAEFGKDAPDALAAERERVAKWLAPLSAEERSTGSALLTEARAGMFYLRDFYRDPRITGEMQSDVPDWLRQRFMQPNATMNYRAAIAVDEQRLAALPADKLLAAVAGHRRLHDELKERLSGFTLRNPVGRALVGETTWDATEYMFRLHDLDAHLRLAALAVEIRARKLEPEAVAAYVNAAGAPALNPYSGKTFQWNAEKRELSTTSHSKNNRYAQDGRFVIKIWR